MQDINLMLAYDYPMDKIIKMSTALVKTVPNVTPERVRKLTNAFLQGKVEFNKDLGVVNFIKNLTPNYTPARQKLLDKYWFKYKFMYITENPSFEVIPEEFLQTPNNSCWEDSKGYFHKATGIVYKRGEDYSNNPAAPWPHCQLIPLKKIV